MSRKSKKPKKPDRKNPSSAAAKEVDGRTSYRQACGLAEAGDYAKASALYEKLATKTKDAHLRALIKNDQGTLLALDGHAEAARQRFREALAIDPECEPARRNLAVLEADLAPTSARASHSSEAPPPQATNAGRIAIVSFLFNWPSTGGGTVHTMELAKFLAKAGYEVLHIYARFPPWRIGGVEGSLPYPSQALEFAEADWKLERIKARYRQAVDAFDPDHVIITDSWNIKPHLADAVRGNPYILRFQAMECLCPLNNVRLLPEGNGRVRQCALHQLANPSECSQCLQKRGQWSGSLHQAERELSGVGTSEYHGLLLRSFREAEAVFVVNPLHEAMVSPYTEQVRVVTSGFDPARFPWPWPEEPARPSPGKVTLFFAGLVEELMKGFPVVHEACARLWQRRQGFELVATGDPPGRVDAFTRFVGWQAQDDLPRQLRAADVLVMPTIAQEALGRTAVEAMGVGRPVIASRLGGLPFTVIDGATGLLFEPGDVGDLARKTELLLDDPDLRQRLGMAGRRRFEEHYTWDVIIGRHYRPLLSRHQPAAVKS